MAEKEEIKCGYLTKDKKCAVAIFLTDKAECDQTARYCKIKNKNFVNDAVAGRLNEN